MTNLTEKQRKFVEAYMGKARGNATEAARLAGYAGNDNTLRSVGHENLTKTDTCGDTMSTSGIYEIRNIETGERYIGSSCDVDKRWSDHRRDLKRRIHHNQPLQMAWAEYGPEAFEFRVLKTCDEPELIEHEQARIDGDDWDRLYNVRRTALRPSSILSQCTAVTEAWWRSHGLGEEERHAVAQAVQEIGRRRPTLLGCPLWFGRAVHALLPDATGLNECDLRSLWWALLADLSA